MTTEFPAFFIPEGTEFLSLNAAETAKGPRFIVYLRSAAVSTYLHGTYFHPASELQNAVNKCAAYILANKPAKTVPSDLDLDLSSFTL